MRAPSALRRHPELVTGGAVTGLALLARLAIVLVSQGGPFGLVGYDQSVYYAAADALVSGRTPYRDFTLLHPPGMMLLLSPFAGLGHVIGDPRAFALANLVCSVLGAAGAGLVYLIARRLGVGRRAALLGGCAYALWFVAIVGEYSARLEPVSNFAFLCGVAALLVPPSAARRWPLLAGVAFGFAVTVKLWWIVPVLVLLGWQLLAGRLRRPVGLAAAGLLSSLVAICLPFFLAAPSSMWHLVVVDQAGRRPHADQLHRVELLTGMTSGTRAFLHVSRASVVVVALLAAALLLWCAWRFVPARGLLAVAVVQTGLLMVTPQYYPYYGAFLAPALALVIASAAQEQSGRRWPRFGPLMAALTVVALGLTSAAAVARRGPKMITPFPRGRLAAAVRSVHCVVSDTPMALIELDVLSRDLSRGCPNWVDVVGRTYGVDGLDNATGRPVLRRHNRKWQQDLRTYLLSGDAMISMYKYVGLSGHTQKVLGRLPVLVSSGGYTVYVTGPAGRAAVTG